MAETKKDAFVAFDAFIENWNVNQPLGPRSIHHPLPP